ncbi:MAG TPA: AAA family ATPase, partial [Candidatus Hydrogenedentes bacterium]|nr:AAA family ATPase [Candidatus Hydrogenedentota bacterium]
MPRWLFVEGWTGMLETLRITNYALIDQLEVDFSQGFNVLTGETGVGKSIIIGALNLALGARASAETVRDGSAKASVDAVFRIESPSRRLAALLEENAIEREQGELLLTRTIAPDGRSRAYVNGSLVPISALAAIGDELVDIHGQHEHQSLMKIDRQLDLLDAYADVEKDVADIANGVAHLREMDRAIAALETDDRERAR